MRLQPASAQQERPKLNSFQIICFTPIPTLEPATCWLAIAQQAGRTALTSDKLILFDCDGVLVDSEPLAAVAYEHIFAKHGIVIGREIFARCVGMKQADILAQIETLTGYRLPRDNEPDIWQETKRLFGKSLQPTKGLTDFLNRLETPRCVASSSSLERINFSLHTTGLDRFFSENTIFSSSMVRQGKPAPDLFLYAAAQCGFLPEQCIVIEDSHFGVQGALRAGMKAIGFTGGSHSDKDHAQRLLANGASAACTSWEDVAEILFALGYV